MMNIYGEYFYGNKISAYGLEHNRVDYGTLAKAFDAVLNNNIIGRYEWDQISGFVDYSEEIEELQERADELEQSRRDGFEPEYYARRLAELEDQIEELRAEEESANFPEIFQYYIVSNSGAELLQEAGEIVFYNYDLDMYLWGVTHYGTSWDYVLTDIPCNTGTI